VLSFCMSDEVVVRFECACHCNLIQVIQRASVGSNSSLSARTAHANELRSKRRKARVSRSGSKSRFILLVIISATKSDDKRELGANVDCLSTDYESIVVTDGVWRDVVELEGSRSGSMSTRRRQL